MMHHVEKHGHCCLCGAPTDRPTHRFCQSCWILEHADLEHEEPSDYDEHKVTINEVKP